MSQPKQLGAPSGSNKPSQASLPEAPQPQSPREIARQLGLKRVTGEAYYRRSLQAYETGDLDNALADVSEAIYYDSNHAEYYATRGIYFLADHKKDEARLDLEYAIKLKRREWVAHFGLGMLCFEEGNYQQALIHFDDALRFGHGARHERHPEVWFYRAVTHHLLNDDEKASADIDKAINYFDDSDKRLKEARAWKKEIDKELPQPASKPAAKKAKGKKSTQELPAGKESLRELADAAKNAPLELDKGAGKSTDKSGNA